MKLTEKIRKEKLAQQKIDKLTQANDDNEKITTETGVYVKGVDNILVRLSKCCKAIPGDEIVGFITKGRGVTVHRKECPNISFEDKKRLLDVEWVKSAKHKNYTVTLQIHGFNNELLLNSILLKLSESKIMVTKINSEIKEDKTCTINVNINVKNTDECKFIEKKLRQISDIYSVERIVK